MSPTRAFTPSTSGTNDRTEATSTMPNRLRNNADDITKRDVQKGVTERLLDFMLELDHLRVTEGDDIITHLLALENTWEHINLICPKDKLDALMTDDLFKIHIAISLPPSWKTFTSTLFDDQTKDHLNVHDFITEYIRECEKREAGDEEAA